MSSSATATAVMFSFLAVGFALTTATTSNAQEKAKRCVVVWSEGTAPTNVYPHDINGAIAEGLKEKLEGWEIVTASIKDPDQGISDALLNRADVLIWWGHKKHGEVKDELVAKIQKRVTDDGMGFIALHSAHFAKPNIKLMSIAETKKELFDQVQPKNRVAAWGAYKADTTAMLLKVTDEAHPITKGIPKECSFANGERYSDPYAVPEPKATIFEGTYTVKDGSTSSSKQGFCWEIGKGKMFYFQPGHETNPIFFDPNVRQIVANAVLWAAPEKK